MAKILETDWLLGRCFKVKMGRQTLGLQPVSEVLPQESPLSPSLFNVLVGDLPMAIWVLGIQVFQFAEDTAILATGRSEVNSVERIDSLSQASQILHQVELSVNENKT